MKHYVDVICIYGKNGSIKPLYIIWDDGSRYPIDRITQIVPAASLYGNGVGMRYTCLIGSQYRYLFLEDGKWFVEQIKRSNCVN
ncbi:MAG: hypothetical protein IJS38_02840 [Erysipelotrichaceae bacterium]|nr:hypothetical protein [Erysipelotrichaceae bacterium]MBQ4252429.1 hypothetical protein [Erysipelotrichaceae bacterium]MBQ7223488.1 hypothetical protein [Erysipelotrichaceae bacterium]